MAGQYDDWSLERLIDEHPGEFVDAVVTLSTDENGTFDQTEFTKLAIALAEGRGMNLFSALNAAVDDLGLDSEDGPLFPEFLERIVDHRHLYGTA